MEILLKISQIFCWNCLDISSKIPRNFFEVFWNFFGISTGFETSMRNNQTFAKHLFSTIFTFPVFHAVFFWNFLLFFLLLLKFLIFSDYFWSFWTIFLKILKKLLKNFKTYFQKLSIALLFSAYVVTLGKIDPSINFWPKYQIVPGFERDLSHEN